MNSYATIADIKSNLGITSTDNDALIAVYLEITSREIDVYCNRHFFSKTDTQYYDSNNRSVLHVNDLLSVSTLKTDDDADDVYETTWTTDDYALAPYNIYPKRSIILTHDSDYFFPLGKKLVEIAGVFGYGNGTSASPFSETSITATVADATSTSLTLSESGTVSAGHTILVESEQMYVSAIDESETVTATVERGVNGTTAAAHTAKTVYTAQYPKPVVHMAIWATSQMYNEKAKEGYQSEQFADYKYVRSQRDEQQWMRVLGAYRLI